MSTAIASLLAANRVFLDEGIVHNVYVGDQTYESVKRVEAETLPLVEALEREGLPVLLLADLREKGRSSAGSRRAAKEALDKVPRARVALFGGDAFVKHLSNFILLAAGMGDRARHFGTREEAVAWLRRTP